MIEGILEKVDFNYRVTKFTFKSKFREHCNFVGSQFHAFS